MNTTSNSASSGVFVTGRPSNIIFGTSGVGTPIIYDDEYEEDMKGNNSYISGDILSDDILSDDILSDDILSDDIWKI